MSGAGTPSGSSGVVVPAAEVAQEVHLPSGRNSVDYDLHPIQKGELVHAAADIVKDKKTGKHYKRVKKPAYSVARSKGAARVDQSHYHGAPIGLGHVLPTHEHKNNNSSSVHRPSSDVSSQEAQLYAREQAMFERMRSIMREEIRLANRGHSDSIKQHIDEAMEKNMSEGGSNDTYNEKPAKKLSQDSIVLDPAVAERGGMESEQEEELEFPNPWARIRYHCREPFAEFLACFVLLTFGDGINVQVQLSALVAPDMPKGEYLSISFGWGIAVMCAIYVSGGISGGHINPGVTLVLACYRGFPWRKVPIYWAAQLLGGIMGALCIYGLYVIPIRMIDPNQTQTTAQLFCTFPAVST